MPTISFTPTLNTLLLTSLLALLTTFTLHIHNLRRHDSELLIKALHRETLAANQRYTNLRGTCDLSYERLHDMKEKVFSPEDGTLDQGNVVRYRKAVAKQTKLVEEQKKEVQAALEEAEEMRRREEDVRGGLEGRGGWVGRVVRWIPGVGEEV